MRLSPSHRFVVSSLFASLLLPAASWAQTPFGLWINPNSTNSYSDASKWIAIDGELPGGVPGPTNDAYIFDGTLLVEAGGDFNPQQLIMGWESFHVGEFLQTGGSTRTESWTKVGIAGNQVFNQSGGTYSAGDLAVGWINPATSSVGVGVMNLSGGTFDSRAATFIGLEGATGTVNISGGTYNATGNVWGSFRIADYGTGTGTVNLSGTGVVNASLYTAVGGSGNGTLNISGGTWNSSSSDIVLGDRPPEVTDWTGTGVVNQSGGTVNASAVLLQEGTYNLDGGILSTFFVHDTKAEATGVFNFDGGTLRARGSNDNFLEADSIEIKSGGATIDTDGNEVWIRSAMTGAGGLTKKGGGKMVLFGENSFSGSTVIEAGVLEIYVTNGVAQSYGAAMQGAAGSLWKSGPGTLSLGGSVSYNGETQILGGTLILSGVFTSGGASSTNTNAPTYVEGGELRVVAGADYRPWDLRVAWTTNTTARFVQTGGASSVRETVIGLFGSGTNEISGGTFTALESTFIGMFGTGRLSISGGTYNALGNNAGELGSFRIGDWGGATGSGTITLSGTGVVNASSYTAVGGLGNGTLNVSGGTWNSVSNDIVLGDRPPDVTDWFGTGVVNQTGGAINARAVFLQAGTFNLSGGVLTVEAVGDTKLEAVGVFNFNGGILQASVNHDDFLMADTVEIKSGGATIDTAGNEVSINKAMSGAGGLTKTGSGLLRLTAANSYAGPTAVDAGTLVVSNAALTATILPDSTVVNFSTPPGVGTYSILSGALDAASLASSQIDGLGAGLAATLTNNPNLQVVVAAQSGYAGWSQGAPLNSANQLLYAIGGASSPTATDGVPSVTTVNSNTVSITAVVRTNDPSLAVFGQSILNLATGTWITNDVSMSVSTNQAGLPADTQRQIFSTPRAPSDSKKFLRLQTTLGAQ